MMTEQQTALKNDEMQEKWKQCVMYTCYAYRQSLDIVARIEMLWEAVRVILNSIAEAFKRFMQEINLTFTEIRDIINEPPKHICKSYPHSYPHSVDNFPENTKGYPKPIMRCARSRC